MLERGAAACKANAATAAEPVQPQGRVRRATCAGDTRVPLVSGEVVQGVMRRYKCSRHMRKSN